MTKAPKYTIAKKKKRQNLVIKNNTNLISLPNVLDQNERNPRSETEKINKTNCG